MYYYNFTIAIQYFLVKLQIDELKFAVPTEKIKIYILDIWRRSLKFRNELRNEGKFLQFMTDFPVASAFSGLLVRIISFTTNGLNLILILVLFQISEDYKLLKPEASSFNESWTSYQLRILERHQDMFRYIKDGFLRALAIVRSKNPTRGSKRMRDQDAKDLLKINPLHGVIGWIHVS